MSTEIVESWRLWSDRFIRLLAALFAFVTPALLTANSSLSFGLFFAFAAIAAAIGLFWVPRLPKATELEPAEAVFAPEVSTVPTA